MKTRTILIALAAMMASLTVFGQEKAYKDHIWSWENNKRAFTLGMYGGLNISYSEVMDKAAPTLGARIGLVFNSRWGIGLVAYGSSHDELLYLPEDDKPVRLESGYTGLLLEYIQPLGNRFKMNFSLITGSGLAQYRYDKEYHKELSWTEEFPDRTTFSVLEPGIEVQTRIGNRWWIGANATYRFTSPVEMIHTGEDILQTYTAGITLKYGIF